MAGLVAQVGFTRLVPHHLIRKSGRPDLRCHPRLCWCWGVKTLMPGTRPGMTVERQCVSPVMAGLSPRLTIFVMAGLVAQVEFTRLVPHHLIRKSGRPDLRCHPRLCWCWGVKTLMPGTRPGMTVERQCVSPVMAGLVTASHYFRHGRACRASRVYPTCASSFNSQVGQARLAVPSTSLLVLGREDIDARHKAGHDGGEAVRFTRHGRACHRVSLSPVRAGLVAGMTISVPWVKFDFNVTA